MTLVGSSMPAAAGCTSPRGSAVMSCAIWRSVSPKRSWRSASPSSHLVQQHPPHVHRMRDVLDRLLAAVLVAQRELVSYLFVNRARDTDTAWIGEALQPRRDVDPITVDLLAL